MSNDNLTLDISEISEFIAHAMDERSEYSSSFGSGIEYALQGIALAVAGKFQGDPNFERADFLRDCKF